MTCRDFADFLAECPDCVAYLQQYRDTIRVTTHAGDDVTLPMPDELVRAIVLASRVASMG